MGESVRLAKSRSKSVISQNILTITIEFIAKKLLFRSGEAATFSGESSFSFLAQNPVIAHAESSGNSSENETQGV
jgi:hypothetical protein